MRVVRRGGVEVVVDDEPIDLLGEGDVFGYASMLAGLPATVGFRAAEDTLAYRLPDEAVRELFARPEGLRYVVRHLDAFDQQRLDAPRRVDDAQRPVGTLLRRPALLCDPETPVREAARQATTAGTTSIVVPLADGTLGIVTDRDLRSRVVAAGLDGATPLREIMSAPAYTVTADRLGSEVLLDMLDRDVRHFPVLSTTGQVVRRGVGHRAAGGRAPDAVSPAQRDRPCDHRRGRRDGAPPAARDHHRAARRAVAPSAVSATLTVVLDAAVRRLLDLAVADEGPPPYPFAWLALGSHARREVVPSSDLDSAIAWVGDDDDPVMRAYAARVAGRVGDVIARAGIRACEGGASAARPAFARSLDSWLGAVASWQDDPTQEKALMLASVIAEAQPIWGMHAGAPMVAAFRDARRHPQLLRGLARVALAHRPPTGFLRDIVVEHSGEHAGRLDLKHGGLLPIVDLARYAGLAAGVTSATTRDRLRTAASAGDPADVGCTHARIGLRPDLRAPPLAPGRAAARRAGAGRPPGSGDARPAHPHLPARRVPRDRQGAEAHRERPRPARPMRWPRPLIQRPRSPAARAYRQASVDAEVPWRAARFAVVDLETHGPRRAEARDHLVVGGAGRRGPYPRRRDAVRPGSAAPDA